MADLRLALRHALRHEGGYSNHRADRGGETYKGVSRVWHPDWPGWAIIDAAKQQVGFPGSLEMNTALQDSVVALYRVHYWNFIRGDALRDQALADELLEQAINTDPFDAVRRLQRVCNLLNRSYLEHPLFADLKRDGRFGPATLGAVNVLLAQDEAPLLLRALNREQYAHYRDLTERDPSQEVFFRGWLTRT